MPVESNFVRGVFQGDFNTDHVHAHFNMTDEFIFTVETEDTEEMLEITLGKNDRTEEVYYIGESKSDVQEGRNGICEEVTEEINYCPRCMRTWRDSKPQEICSNCNTVIRKRGVKPSP